MTDQQAEFEQRRSAVMRKHLVNDPKYRAHRRARKYAFLRGVLGLVGSIALTLVLLKTALVAFHGEAGYTLMLASPIEATRDMELVQQALLPDPLTSAVAEAVAAYLPNQPQPTGTASATPITPEPES